MIYINISFFIYRYDEWEEKIHGLDTVYLGAWISESSLVSDLYISLNYLVSDYIYFFTLCLFPSFFTLFILLHIINLTINILQKK